MSGDNLKAENAELRADLVRSKARVAELEADASTRKKALQDLLQIEETGLADPWDEILAALRRWFKVLEDLEIASIKHAWSDVMVVLLKHDFSAQREILRLTRIGMKIAIQNDRHHEHLAGTCKVCGYKGERDVGHVANRSRPQNFTNEILRETIAVGNRPGDGIRPPDHDTQEMCWMRRLPREMCVGAR